MRPKLDRCPPSYIGIVPARELIEGVGLLIEQMVRTNLVLEDIAKTISADIAERKKDRDERESDERLARIARRSR